LENQKLSSIQWLSITVIIGSVLISGAILYDKLNYTNESIIGEDNQRQVVEQQDQPKNQNKPSLAKVSIDDDAVLGNENAVLTMIEFSDFQCPYCRKFAIDTLPQIKKEYINTGKVKFVYRDFPLSFHPGAQPAGEGAECAKEQGKFQEMHDKIFDEQQKQGQGTVQFGVDEIKKWASQIGLSVSKFNQCIESGKYKEEVKKDIADGQAVGVRGTPAFFIGESTESGIIEGEFVSGARPFSAFKEIIDRLLNN
jgi:protein-disulfide isomerase